MTSYRVLVVDHNASERAALMAAVGHETYTALGAESLSQATEAMRTLNVDVVLVHETLPDGDGAHWGARSVRTYRDTIILLMRDKTWDATARRAIHSGMHGVLHRSIGAPELRERITSEIAARDRRGGFARTEADNNRAVHRHNRERIATHELGNILSPIVGIADLLYRRLEGRDIHGMLSLVETLRERAMKARELISKLREIHALESDSYAVAFRVVDIVPLVLSTIKSQSDECTHLDITIEATIDVDSAPVAIDFDLMPNALISVLRCAIKRASQEPDVTRKIVSVVLEERGTDYAIRVAPHASSVPPKASDPFVADRTAKSESEFNLEMTHARLIAVAHGGAVETHAHPSGGTGVTIVLPKADR